MLYSDKNTVLLTKKNEKGHEQNVIFYIHGGAYVIDINSQYWQIIETLINKKNRHKRRL